MKIFKIPLWGALLLAFVLGGCAVPYRVKMNEQMDAQPWSEKQKLAALYYSYRLLFLRKTEAGLFVVVYSRLPKEDVIRQLEQNLTDLEKLLDPKNEEWGRYVNAFGMRPYFERQELMLKAVLARILVDENDKKFKEFVGETWSQGNGSSGNNSRGYDERVLTVVNLPETFPFKSKVIEDARASGLLKEIARTVKVESQDLYQREPDPNDPTDSNKFVWMAKKVGYERVEYKILVPNEQPKDNKPNYVEIWRLVDGKRESSPAVKAFLDGSGFALLVLDTDRETEMIGFGLPNVVQRVGEGELEGSVLIARIFPDTKKDKRTEPKVPPIRVEIVRAGSPVDPWQTCAEGGGCSTPKSYRREPTKDNYNVRVGLEAGRSKDALGRGVSIAYVAKEWTDGKGEYSWSPGKVVEYYRPKAYCAGSALLSANVLHLENKKKIRIACKDGTETDRIVTPTLNVVIEERPFQIAFTAGETRWLVWDSDGDGKFDKRRKVSPTLKYNVGSYPFGDEPADGGNTHIETVVP